jgi:diguanylate cyclase (GGDEF)-like protein
MVSEQAAENKPTVDATQRQRPQQAEATDFIPQRFGLSRRTFLFPIASFIAAVAGLAVVLAQELFGSERLDLFVVAFVILSVGLVGFFFGALCRGRLLDSVGQTEARSRVRCFQLHDMAMRDDLTGLPNRRCFDARLQDELSLARDLRRHLALVVFDVDGFKAINDRYGHKAGDTVLANVGELLAEKVRGSDMPARIGGDEFAVIMPETDRNGAYAAAERLRQALEGALVLDEGDVQVLLRVSLGVSGYPWGGDRVEELVQGADTRMYAAKSARGHVPA